jgi:hypothetical protein
VPSAQLSCYHVTPHWSPKTCAAESLPNHAHVKMLDNKRNVTVGRKGIPIIKSTYQRNILERNIQHYMVAILRRNILCLPSGINSDPKMKEV